MAAIFRAFAALTLRAAKEDYPLLLHIPHSLVSIARYRRWRSHQGLPPCWLYDAIVSLLTHSQGGGITAFSLLQGNVPWHYFACRSDYVQVHFASYIAVYWSPVDIVYKYLANADNLFRWFCEGCDALDIAAGLCGLIDISQSKYPTNYLLPVLVGITYFNSGQVYRTLDQRSRGDTKVSSFLTAPGTAVVKGALISQIYLLLGHRFRSGRHRDSAIVAVASLYVGLTLLETCYGFDGFAEIHAAVKPVLQGLRDTLKLGPADGRHHSKMD